MEVDNLVDALDEFDSRYLESYHQVTAKLASLAIGCTLRLSSPLFGPRDLDDVPRGLDPEAFDLDGVGDDGLSTADCNKSTNCNNFPSPTKNFPSSTNKVPNSTDCNNLTQSTYSNSIHSTHSPHFNLNTSNSISITNIHTANHNADYTTTNYGLAPLDEGSLASIGAAIGPSIGASLGAIGAPLGAFGPPLGASIDNSAGAATGTVPASKSPNPSADPSCAAVSRSTPNYPTSDLRPCMLLKPARAESIRPNPLRVRLFLTLLITPKPRRIERRNTVATYVGNPFYRRRGSLHGKSPVCLVRLLGENHCTFEMGEIPLTGRRRPGEESIYS